MSEVVDQCVQAVMGSVRWLDYNKPGWASKIDLATFDFLYHPLCVAGQLSLTRAETKLSQGFDSPLPHDHVDAKFSYTFMDSLWRIFIQKRIDHVIPEEKP